jgi:hypothetical protein
MISKGLRRSSIALVASRFSVSVDDIPGFLRLFERTWLCGSVWRYARLAVISRSRSNIAATARQASRSMGQQSGDQAVDLAARHGVKTRRGLVEKQHGRVVEHRSRQRDALTQALR